MKRWQRNCYKAMESSFLNNFATTRIETRKRKTQYAKRLRLSG